MKGHRSLREQINQQNEKFKEESKERYNPMKQMKERNDMIYQYYLDNDISYRELAKMFNVSYGQVRTLVSRRGVKKK